MAKFRDSTMHEPALAAPLVQSSQPAAAAPASAPATNDTAVVDRSIGDIISEARNLTAEQVERILAHQRQHGVRFGEAAVALGLASQDDVLSALSQQFHYPYSPEDRRAFAPELVALNQPFSQQAESFRAIRSQLMLRLLGENMPRSALAVISPEAGDGKTFLSANLAATLAQLGGRTLLVDADLRGPRQHEVFNLHNRSGLSGILSGRAEAQVIQQVEGVPSLFVLPVGVTPPNPLELIERPAFGLLMRELTSKFDHVIVDTPAMIYGSDATAIAVRCGAALVVARKSASKMQSLQAMVAGLANTPARLAGVVVNEF